MLMKFLQTQGCMRLPAAIMISSAATNLAFNFVLVGSLGFAGAPWASSASRALQVGRSASGCRCIPHHSDMHLHTPVRLHPHTCAFACAIHAHRAR